MDIITENVMNGLFLKSSHDDDDDDKLHNAYNYKTKLGFFFCNGIIPII